MFLIIAMISLHKLFSQMMFTAFPQWLNITIPKITKMLHKKNFFLIFYYVYVYLLPGI